MGADEVGAAVSFVGLHTRIDEPPPCEISVDALQLVEQLWHHTKHDVQLIHRQHRQRLFEIQQEFRHRLPARAAEVAVIQLAAVGELLRHRF